MNSRPSQDRRIDDAQDRKQVEPKRGTHLLLFAIVSLTITGYFVGITAPMSADSDTALANIPKIKIQEVTDDTIPAVAYLDVPGMIRTSSDGEAAEFKSLKQLDYDILTEVRPATQHKLASLSKRAERRAYSGAPPTVPHPIEQMTANSCMTCHAEGIVTKTVRATKMPHPFMINCTQCHVESASEWADGQAFRESLFVGMSAPSYGPRAFDKAPPQIPHTTWMRQDCLACHGRTASPGLEVSHPWRTNCTQCHAPSAQFEQATQVGSPRMVPPLVVAPSEE